MNRLLSSIKADVGIVTIDASEEVVVYQRNGLESRRFEMRRTAQKEQFLPLLIMHPVLAERIRVVFDTLPDFIFLLSCLFIFGYLLQEPANESAALLEIRIAKQELGLSLAQSVKKCNDVMIPFQ